MKTIENLGGLYAGAAYPRVNTVINNFSANLDLIDAWRVLNSEISRFTWHDDQTGFIRGRVFRVFRVFSHLSFDEHVTEVVCKCIGSLCQINRVKHLFDRSTLITIINSLVFSKLFYCSSTWASTTKKNIARLQKVQNFAARIVTGARKYDHITPILKELHWLPVAKQLEVRDTLMAFKCIKGLAPPSLCNKFTTRSQVHNRNTRNNDKLNIPFFRSATGQRSFSYRAAQLWNDLPEILTNIVSFNVFKNAIKRRALDEFLSHC